jgi:hypothetical protein
LKELYESIMPLKGRKHHQQLTGRNTQTNQTHLKGRMKGEYLKRLATHG